MATTENAASAAQRGSFARGWPSLVLTVLVVLAALYSFSHRPPPPFPATQVHADGLQVNGLTRQGDRYIAVGEQGRILIADQPQGPWREASVAAQRDSTLTDVTFVADNIAVAVGHDGWILRSEDRGQTWAEAQFSTEHSDPFLGVAGPYEGTLYAYGAFGKFMVSTDLGKTWQMRPLVEEGAEEAAPEPVEVDTTAADYDPFASYTAGASAGGSLADRHLNDMARAADGSLWLVGERGLLAQSKNGGESWRVLDPIYAGSLFGIIELPGGELLAFGMRGHAFVSRDNGNQWVASDVPLPLSLFDGAVDREGNAVLVGASDAVLKSTDKGASFKLVSQKDRRGLAAVLPLDDGGWLTGGEAGIKPQQPGMGKAEESTMQGEGDAS